MEEGQVSHTALSTAFIRAYHVRHDTPLIFNDSLAHHLLTGELQEAIARQMARPLSYLDPGRAASCPDQATALACSMRAMAVPSVALSRARYAEDCLALACRQGVRQYVILGAGMDTFAFRNPDTPGLEVFELDHPATQAYKIQRLAQLVWELPQHLHFVPVDLARESLAGALTGTSYSFSEPCFFNWLGVTMFLTREVVFGTLQAIAGMSPPGSAVIFDYMDLETFIPGKTTRRVQMMLDSVRRLGEPVISGLDPLTLNAELKSRGLRLRENLSPGDIQQRYFEGRTDGYRACEHAYLAWAVVE